MLEHTFVHIEGIGPKTEAELWSRGFRSWRDVNNGPVAGANGVDLVAGIIESRRRLALSDAAFFRDCLPTAERWRMYPDFLRETAFLDIETTGLSPGESIVTLVGVLDQAGYTAYVRGDNLDELPARIPRYRQFVTFNGAAFDLPFLEREFAGDSSRSLFAHAGHLDLRYPLARLGLSGGLKKIERSTGVGRPSSLGALEGSDAVSLWRMANEGEPDALQTLIRYNAEDVASLPLLARIAVAQLAAALPIDARPVTEFPRFDTDSLPYDPTLVEYLTRGRRGVL